MTLGGAGVGGAGVQETDLPPEMLSSGWRKFWSKREQRVYYWNRVSGESLWDMPGGGQAHPPPPGVSVRVCVCVGVGVGVRVGYVCV